ncbi:hypothetical protein, partial [Umezakia ovalisporum]|uniref:hypothetical protein n=1 Tax=Umezakia ovalisporum TaxID=75695 RepID=UPI0039C62D10
DNHQYSPKINITILDGDGFMDSVLIEGDRDTLNFFADLIKSMANDDQIEKVSISPDGAGSLYFSESSKLGLYISKN